MIFVILYVVMKQYFKKGKDDKLDKAQNGGKVKNTLGQTSTQAKNTSVQWTKRPKNSQFTHTAKPGAPKKHFPHSQSPKKDFQGPFSKKPVKFFKGNFRSTQKRNEVKHRPTSFRNDTSRHVGKIIGTISINSRGVGYVSVEHLDDDLEIQPEFLLTALHSDTVEIEQKGFQNGRKQGRVTKIVSRKREKFVGTMYVKNSIAEFVPDDKRFYPKAIFTNGKTEFVDSTKVVISIVRWVNDQTVEVSVLEVLGKKGNNSVEMFSILVDKGFPARHSDEVEKAAQEVGRTEGVITSAEIAKRRDFRKVPTFTIDPVDAKDFDDAISMQKLPGGLYEVGVHIADVSHYVREGTVLDGEADSRQFSVYLVDRTIPMLPEVLSNNLCSLNPNEEKLTFSAVFVMDGKGVVKERWFGKTIIRSHRRYSYEEAQQVLVTRAGDYTEELLSLNAIAKELRAQRDREGAIDFEQDEIKFRLDETGKPIEVIRKSRFDAHKLVEEFMLLANREVAEYFYTHAPQKKMGPFLYRVHDLPNKEKLEDLSAFARAFGHTFDVSSKIVSPKDIQALIRAVEGKAEEGLIKTAAVRSMAKAVYATKNIGHFGLAFEYYAHFTSPIRRYADLIVHRLLQVLLTGEGLKDSQVKMFDDIARRATEREIAAAEAERNSIKYKQVEFMLDKVGQEFAGIVSGVTEWGIYVEEAHTRAEGMIRLKDLPGDYYELKQKQYAVVGKKTGKKYSLGDSVKFKITGADMERKVLDYVLVESL